MMLVLLACARTIAPPLDISPITPEAASEPDDPIARIGWMIDGDPLARRPRVPRGPVEPAVAAFLAVDGLVDPKPMDWFGLETTNPGTSAVPLARGARLAVLEVGIGDPLVALGCAVPLSESKPGEGQTRPPLDWLDGPSDGLIVVLERSILLGWLDGPAIPLAGPAHALASPTYDRLSARPSGRLLLARASGVHDDAAAVRGRKALEDATWMALLGAAADRDAEDRAFQELKAAVAREAGVDGDPVAALLTSANADLTADAGTEASTGLALVSQAALRLRNACPDAPCGGLDRVGALRAAVRWGSEPWSSIWEVIAAKDALDQLRASFETPFVTAAIDKEVELLLGRGAELDRSILLYNDAGPPVRLALSRALRAGDLTSKDDLLLTLKNRLIEMAKTVLPQAPERLREPLERIARRG